MLLNCGVREGSWESLGQEGDQISQILKKINSECSLGGLMLKLKLQYVGHLMWRADSLGKALMLGKIEDRRRRGWHRWDDWTASPLLWTWVWANSRRWWRTGKAGMLQPWGLKESDTTEQLNNNNNEIDTPWRWCRMVYPFYSGAGRGLKWSEVAQSCPTLCDPVDCGLPGSEEPLSPWNFSVKSIGVGCHFLLQGIFPTQGSNPGLPHCRQMLYHLSHNNLLRSFSP